MKAFRFHIANVFAESHFGGNQLVVFPDAQGIPGGAMQAVARQFNVSETTFVLPATDPAHTAKVRIFTPAAELPFAGHPTIGTAAVLARLHHGATAMILEEAVGSIPVNVRFDGVRTLARFVLPGPIDRPGEAVAQHEVAQSLSLADDDVCDTWFASAGVPFCFVQLVSSAAVDKIILDRGRWASGVQSSWSPHLFAFAEDAVAEQLYARMFAPALGVDEDPATGAAAAALIGSLAERRLRSRGSISRTITQGVRMGRPSVISASADMVGDRAANIAVGGNTIIVADGSMSIPTTE